MASTSSTHQYQSFSSIDMERGSPPHNQRGAPQTSIKHSASPSFASPSFLSPPQPRSGSKTPTESRPTPSFSSSSKSRNFFANEPSGSQGSFRATYSRPENNDGVVLGSKDSRMATTISMLDTSANANSAMSRTHRMMDEKLRQRQVNGEQHKYSSSELSYLPGSFKPLNVENDKKHKGKKKEDQRNADLGSSRSSRKDTSNHHHHSASTSSSTLPMTREALSSKHKRQGSKGSLDKGSFSEKPLERGLSNTVPSSNSRGITTIPPPDTSLVQAHHRSSKPMMDDIEIQKRVKNLDECNKRVTNNNQRLKEWFERFLVTRQQGDYDHHRGEEDELTYVEHDEEREKKERTQWKEDKARLEQSMTLQQELQADLEREREANKEKDSQLQELLGILELSEALKFKLEQARQQLDENEKEWEIRLDQEKYRHERIRVSLEDELTNKEKELDETVQQSTGSQSEVRKLTSNATALHRQIQELEDQLRHQEVKSRGTLSEQAKQIEEYENKIENLEKRLEHEQDQLAKNEEAGIHIKTRVQELLQSIQEKDDELQDKDVELQALRIKLEGREGLLDRRQVELDEVDTLLREQQEQHKGDLRDVTLKSGERHRQLEDEILRLEQELEKRSSQLSQSNSSSNSAVSTIHHLQTKIQEQEGSLLEKDDRIQTLEQELDLAQQQAQNVIADLEQDIHAWEEDCSKLENKLQEANHRADEGQMKVGDLEMQLGHRDQELLRELDHRQAKERQLLERLLNDMEFEDQDEGQLDQFSHDNDSIDGSIRYLYSRLQERVRELKQECLHQEDLRQQLNQMQGELVTSENIQQHLRQLLAEITKGGQILSNGSVSSRHSRDGRSNSVSSRHQQQQARNDPYGGDMKSARIHLQELLEQVSILEDEKSELLEKLALAQEQIQEYNGDRLDRTYAVKDLTAKYMSKIEEMMQELARRRAVIVKQEGTMFLYLSVIEKMKMQLRGDVLEDALSTKDVVVGA
ncbi:hypothetical protein BGZ65_006486 [Modicella reniformis]|uniref:Uncharacterized protein n=1 Tax=Modicella reniformis TaxID=1440133 RepID=A0A9P6IJR8_9FUNG|nr:hypothetical protein BGZ65_006486 [Modicella reniformis]